MFRIQRNYNIESQTCFWKKKNSKEEHFSHAKKNIYWTFDHDQIGESCGKKKKKKNL